jgi:hypothetical protein
MKCKALKKKNKKDAKYLVRLPSADWCCTDHTRRNSVVFINGLQEWRVQVRSGLNWAEGDPVTGVFNTQMNSGFTKSGIDFGK